MGRLAILLVVIGTAGAMHAGFSRTETRYNTVLTQADYQEQVLARETAESALNLIVSRVKETHSARLLSKQGTSDLSYDVNLSNEPYRGRKYDVQSTQLGTGDIDVHAKGMLGINEYTINALISYQYGNVLNALTFDGDYEHLKINATNKMSVSGLDRQTDGYNKFLGSEGSGADVHAISVRSENTFTDIYDDVHPQQLEGIGGEGDIVNEPPNIDLADLANQIRAFNGMNKVLFEGGGQITKKTPLGSRAVPAIAVVTGDFKMKNQSEGYGVLLVDGDLDIGAGSRFEGLILVTGANRNIDIGGNVEIYGSLASHFTGDSKNDKTDINLRGDSRVQYSSEALIRVGEFIGMLSEENNTELVVTRLTESASRADGRLALKRSY